MFVELDQVRLINALKCGVRFVRDYTDPIPIEGDVDPVILKVEVIKLSCMVKALQNIVLAQGSLTQDELNSEINKELEKEVAGYEELLTKSLGKTIKLL